MQSNDSSGGKRVVAGIAIAVVVLVAGVVVVLASGRSEKSPRDKPNAADAGGPRRGGKPSAPPLPVVAADVAAAEPPPDAPTAAPPATDMVDVPDAGPFWRGHPDLPPHAFGNPDTHPLRHIRLRGFRIDRTEVTFGMYGRCVAEGVCEVPHCESAPFASDPELPVVCVSWQNAASYCAWIGGRLPTEAEWEKAARGMDGRKYPWGGAEPTCDLANFNECRTGALPAAAVPEAAASPYGVLGLAGNVAEWTADWYDPLYFRTCPPEDPSGPDAGTERVTRGGSWAAGSRYLMTGYRVPVPPDDRRSDLGFRCAADLP